LGRREQPRSLPGYSLAFPARRLLSGSRRSPRLCPWPVWSVLVDVIAVLEVAVAVVDVIHMIAMGYGLAAVLVRVRARMGVVHRLLAMVLAGVHMVHMVVVPDDLTAVARVVLVIGRFGVGSSHLSSKSLVPLVGDG